MNGANAGGGTPTARLAGMGLTCFIVIVVSNVSEAAGAQFGVGLYWPALLVVSACLLISIRGGPLRPPWSPVYLPALFFLATRAFPLLATGDVSVGAAVVAGTARDLVTLPIVMTLLVMTRRFDRAARVAVAVVAVLAGLTMVQEFVVGNATTFGGLSNLPIAEADVGGLTARHSGPLDDPNFWARNLVLFVPLTLSFLLHRAPWLTRAAWLAAAAALLGGLYLTQSRGGLLAVGIAVGAWTVLLGRRYARFLLLAPVAAVLLVAIPGVGSRLATLVDLEEARAGGGDESLVGRAAIQDAGFEMFRDHPAVGVGPGSFVLLMPEYARRLGLATAEGFAAHNLYLEMGAEGGVLGLAGWMVFFGAAMFVALRALIASSRLNRGSSPSLAMLLSAGALAGMVGWGFASLFLHLADLRSLLVVVGLAAALDVDVRARAGALVAGRRPEMAAPALAAAR